jgi:DNA/RNA endonuclease G (NUC1)
VLQNDCTSAVGSFANTFVCTNVAPPLCELATQIWLALKSW